MTDDALERMVRVETKVDILLGRRDDHETRLRSLEQFKWKLIGWAGGAGVIAGIVVQIVARGLGG